MEAVPRHQCLIYDGSPAKMLPVIASQVRDKLREKFQCLYLNSPAMVAGMKSYLYVEGVNVSEAVADGSLILSSDASPLKAGQFDVDRMLDMLEDSVNLALNAGYCGLWATGDMSWEMGPDRNLKRLLEYEWKLEQLFGKYPGLSGICQYHADTLPRDLVCHSLLVHPAIFINGTLARTNSSYVPSAAPILPVVSSQELKLKVINLCSLHPE